MSGTRLEAILRRDRAVVAASLAALTLVAWAYTVWLGNAMSMDGMDMPGMRMDANPFGVGMMPALRPWSAAELASTFVMWAVMMVGMMTPSAAPMVLLYATVARKADARGRPMAATAWFASGYLLAWVGFSLAATGAQWALEQAALLSATMVATSDTLGGAVLIAAGLYQWTPLKDTCLAHCQAPLMFIQRHGGFRREASGSLSLGLRHGVYCIGCCWLLMALLFVGGVMNVLWIAVLAAFVLAEKVVPAGRILPRAVGAVCLTAGLWLLL